MRKKAAPLTTTSSQTRFNLRNENCFLLRDFQRSPDPALRRFQCVRSSAHPSRLETVHAERTNQLRCLENHALVAISLYNILDPFLMLHFLILYPGYISRSGVGSPYIIPHGRSGWVHRITVQGPRDGRASFDAFSLYLHIMTIEVPAGLRSWLFISLLSLDLGVTLCFSRYQWVVTIQCAFFSFLGFTCFSLISFLGVIFLFAAFRCNFSLLISLAYTLHIPCMG